MSQETSPSIAIFGGSFDPPHMAHVLAVATVLSLCEVDAVWIMPVYRHPLHKNTTSWHDRLALCHAAFSLFGDRVVVCETERTLAGKGRTLDLLQHLRSAHPTTAFRLVLGSDQLTNRHAWHGFDEVCRLAPPIVFARPMHPAPAPFEALLTLPDLSSTEARAMLAQGVMPGWLPRSVRQHITRLGLYGVVESDD